ncbi:MAG: Fur family transcriptional regulator [Acidaminococcaceae bacterium]
MTQLEQLLLLMKKRGCRITEQRKNILQVIVASDNLVTAGELAAALQAKGAEVSVDTVYRNLNALSDLGILYRLEKAGGCSLYELIAGEHKHYLICKGCGKREAILGCCAEEHLGTAAQKAGFVVTGHRLEFYGYCRLCAEKYLQGAEQHE